MSGLTFGIERGEIFGFLGPSGAGAEEAYAWYLAVGTVTGIGAIVAAAGFFERRMLRRGD